MGVLFTSLFFLQAIIFIFCIYGLYRKRKNGICKSKKRLDGMTCLVTGGTSGIGLEIAIDFASRGARVVVACPFEEEGISAEKRIIQESGNDNVVFKLLNLASLKSVRNFAADIINTEQRLDILMNNAGIAMSNTPLSEDGLCFTMQVNYLGSFLLTLLLLPLLEKSGTPSTPSRIVNTSSATHYLARWLDVENLGVPNDAFWGFLGPFVTYGRSKLYLVLFSRELKKRLKSSNVVINCVDPGEVGTGIFLNTRYRLLLISFAYCWLFSKTPYEGAQTPLHAALDEKAGQASGLYYRDCAPRESSKAASDEELMRKVWDKSVALVKLSDVELEKILK
ncbi:retinol dehydrogenase 11-like [Ostrinia furnacalis]|uniref:retinol dehydrogenase 11-like n=1 Tax=Ostrinia furnacalis TaxID=93504 RepID=UPI00103A7F82|nr:retinol dehydrogenase 11-like [Ostrinia furnacalis]